MTDESADSGPERLDTLAALISYDPVASREADAWIGLNCEPCSDNEARLITGATDGEWLLAEAIRGTTGLYEPDAEAIAGLLRLAAGSPIAGLLRLGLREAYLDGEPGDRAAVFADIYQRLVLPGLEGDVKERAAALLDGL